MEFVQRTQGRINAGDSCEKLYFGIVFSFPHMSHSIGITSFSKNPDEFCCVGIKATIQPFFLFNIAEFGVHLAELTVDPQGALAIRQVSLPKTGKNQFHSNFLAL